MSQHGNGKEVPAQELQAIVEKYDDRPDQCTIFPTGSDGVKRMSTWVSAREGSFVDLLTVR
jgi:hypothetical protein